MWNTSLSFKGAKEESEEAKEGEEEEGEGEEAAEEGEESQEAAEEAGEEEKEEKEAAGKDESEGKKKAWPEGSSPAQPAADWAPAAVSPIPSRFQFMIPTFLPVQSPSLLAEHPRLGSPSAAWFHVWVQGFWLSWVIQNLNI